MVVWLPEKMHRSCANKLLKMIEEPPNKTLFLMVSEEPEKILQTILSRTQIVNVPKIDDADLSQALTSEFNLSGIELTNVVRLAGGSYRKARILIQNSDENAFNFENFVTIMRLSYARKVMEIMDWSEQVAGIGRERQKSFLNYSVRMVRENFILNLKKPEMVFLNGEEMNFSQRFSPFINEENVWILADELSKAHSDIERNANAKIVFLDLGLKLVKLLRP
jgi:DNA polymerase-3 subunit delta'